jgi:hypothetical protein
MVDHKAIFQMVERPMNALVYRYHFTLAGFLNSTLDISGAVGLRKPHLIAFLIRTHVLAHSRACFSHLNSLNNLRDQHVQLTQHRRMTRRTSLNLCTCSCGKHLLKLRRNGFVVLAHEVSRRNELVGRTKYLRCLSGMSNERKAMDVISIPEQR